jgi:outer membrane protein assembly factor BamB
VLSSPSVDETGNVFVVTEDGYMYYISSAGELIWKSDFNIGISTSPVPSGGTAYIGTDDLSLLGINLNPDLSNSPTDTRKLLPDAVETFSFLANGRVKSSPAFSGNTVFFGGGEYVYALNPNAGGGGGTATTSIGGGSTATTTVPNPIKWRYSINSDVYSSPAVKGNKVYVGADDGYLYALSENVSGSALQSNTTNIINEGKFVWKRKTGDKIRSSPAVATPATTTAPVTQSAQQQTTAIDRVYVGCDDGNLYAYDANGEFKWKFPTAGPVESSPAVDMNGDIYFGSDDGSVYALFPSGALKWRYQTNGAVRSSPAIGPNQRLYVGSDDGYLYCLGQSNKNNSRPDFSIAIANSITSIENDGNPAIITATVTSQSQDPNYLSRIAVVTMDLTPLNLFSIDPSDTTGTPTPVTKVFMLDDGQGQDLVARDGIFTYAFGITTNADNSAIASNQNGYIYTFYSPTALQVGPVPIMVTVEDIYAAQDILNHEISKI